MHLHVNARHIHAPVLQERQRGVDRLLLGLVHLLLALAGVLLGGLPDRHHGLVRHDHGIRVEPADQRHDIRHRISGHARRVDGGQQQFALVRVGVGALDRNDLAAGPPRQLPQHILRRPGGFDAVGTGGRQRDQSQQHGEQPGAVPQRTGFEVPPQTSECAFGVKTARGVHIRHTSHTMDTTDVILTARRRRPIWTRMLSGNG